MADSTISKGTTIVGRIIASTDLEVQGQVEGSIEGRGAVTVTEGALVKSDISGTRVVVAGAVAGNLRGEELVVLERGARVVGDLAAPSIGIRSGALVRGRVETAAPGQVPARATRTAPAVRREPAKQETADKKRPPAPVMPKAAGRAKKAAKKGGKAKAPAPVVPAIKKQRTRKTTKRRGR